MIFARIHAISVFYFVSTSNDRIQLASSEHLEFYLELLSKFSAMLLFIEVDRKGLGAM